MARHMFPDLTMLRLAPVLPRDPEKLADLLSEVPDDRDPNPDDRDSDLDRDARTHDATHLMTAAMSTAASSTTARAATGGRVAISLRWAVNPSIGFPRAPFKVWRRRRQEDPSTPVAGSVPRHGPTTVGLSAQALEVRFDAQPDSGRTLVVEAVGFNGHVLPGQRLVFTSAGSGRFRAAGISALKLSAGGQVANILGLPQHDYVNLPGWTLVDVVGFPFAKNEIGPPDYDPVPQGRAAPSLDGVDAALVRLTAGQLIQRDPPAPGGGLASPTWPFPDPSTFLDVLRRGPLVTVADCLTTSRDDDPSRVQALHQPTHTLAGMHQPGISTPSSTADMSLKTTHYIGLAVGDNPVALGLGFGTFDLAPVRAWGIKEQLPTGTFLANTDWMVTAEVTFWFGTTIDLAAVGFLQAPPTALTQLAATQTFANRPPTRDDVGSAAVLVSWAPTRDPIGAGILLAARRQRPRRQCRAARRRRRLPALPHAAPDRTQRRTAARRAPRGDDAGGACPGLGQRPDDLRGRAPRRARTLGPVGADHPRAGGRPGPETRAERRTHRPARRAAARRSGRARRDPDRRGVVGLGGPVAGPDRDLRALRPPGSSAGVGQRVPDELDRSGRVLRSDHRFRRCGRPIGAGAARRRPPVRWPRLSRPRCRRGRRPPVRARQRPAARLRGQPGPALPADPAGVAVLREREQARLRRLGEGRRGRAVRRAERADRAPGDHGRRPVPGARARSAARHRAVDRRSPTPPVGRGPCCRGRRCPAPRATSCGRPRRPPSTTRSPASPHPSARRSGPGPATSRPGSWPTRPTSLSTFTRLNERPQTATSVELELPGSADTLYVYRLSSITPQNVESARSSDMVLVGVPRLEQPWDAPARGPFRRRRRARWSSRRPRGRGRRRIGWPSTGCGPRCWPRSSTPWDRPGPPRRSPPWPRSRSRRWVARQREPATGVTDGVTPDWRPYVYRVVALGRDLPDDGIRAGRSPASAAASVVVPPPLPPTVSALTVTRNGSATLLSFTTDLPVGRRRPVRRRWWSRPSIATGIRTVLGTIDPTTVPEAAALVLPSSPGPVAATRRRVGGGRVHADRARAGDHREGRRHRDRPARTHRLRLKELS